MDNKTKEKEIRIYMRDWETQKLTYTRIDMERGLVPT